MISRLGPVVSGGSSSLKLFFLVLFSVLLGLSIGLVLDLASTGPNFYSKLNLSDNRDLSSLSSKSDSVRNLLTQAERFVFDNFFGEYKSLEQSKHHILKSYINSLGDKNTFYLNPEEAKQYLSSLSSEFEGIGVVLDQVKIGDNSYVIVSSLLDNGAAKKDGRIIQKSKILKVDNSWVVNKSPSEVAMLIRGPSNTLVSILLHDDSVGEYSVTLVREKVKTEKFLYVDFDQYSYQYIRINDFVDGSVADLKKNWEDIKRRLKTGTEKSLILDLRGNPGGYVEGAILISESFLPEGKVVMYEVNSKLVETRKVVTSDPDQLVFSEIYILIDRNTASAAEILALSLRENMKNVFLVGEKTFGKGTEQKIIENFLDSGGLLSITYQKWTSPTKRIVTKDNPVSPDIDIPNVTDKEIDEILKLIKDTTKIK
ncbi:hypothetical protein D6810_00425 [Candidatus Dojkabacteria bacterium]|uniref:S41 family peptidase n=1 Tax=Candidatus Dojkabacteria bacterium TaxID=2099670 RepID=A0A3M0Z3L2_9BACT|nr:MAG: hypothetical protein D6810_00425 [Candidatus Dojkabacteria bacterium]